MASGAHTTRRQRRTDHPLLARTIGRRQPLAAPVLVHRRATDQAPESHRHHARRPTAASAPISRSLPTTPHHPRPPKTPCTDHRAPCRCPDPAPPTSMASTSPCTPPASARSHSPCRSAVHARCSAVSDDEHAVSTVIAGPSRPRTYDTRPASTLDGRARRRPHRQSLERARTLAIVARRDEPTYTPVRLPLSASGRMPARSSASHTTSSSSRCCGSISSASRGEMPKNPASKSSTASRKPPSRAKPPVASSNRRNSSRLQRVGSGPTPSPPLSSSAQ